MEIESFYGVYLLYNENPQFKGRTYIGYTVNPNRRIRQHNVGKHGGGAKRTSGKGPWAMALIVHGFPNDITALRFEWAWQNPDKSRILKPLNLKKTRKETAFEYRFRVLQHMLRTGPWNRLSLTIRWLLQDYRLDFSGSFPPPDHMAVAYGPVTAVKVGTKQKTTRKTSKSTSNTTNDNNVETEETDGICGNTSDNDIPLVECNICDMKLPSNETMNCYMPNCDMRAHISCLARRFLRDEPDEVMPLRGECVSCGGMLLWGELVRHKEGCYRDPAKMNTDAQNWSEESD